MSGRKRNRGHLGQVVALADILANGVVILMMLIVLSIKLQSDRAQDEINQNADITTILSRDMAKSIIFNDLPSSPPAVLHDYNSCAIAHDCVESLYPILEIHDDHVRMKNENVRLTLREMLVRPNPMDHWVRSFNAAEKHNIRMDIYGVGSYYLALSILKENGIHHPRHWHFLTKPARGGEGEGLSSEDFMARYEDSRSLTGDGLGGQADASGEEETGEQEGEGEEAPFSPEDLGDLTMVEGASFSELSSSGLLPQQGKFSKDAKNKGGGEGEGEEEIKARLREGKFSSIGIKLPNMPMPAMESEGQAIDQVSNRELMLFLALIYLHYGHELGGLQVSYLQNTIAALMKRPRHIRRNSNFPHVIELSYQLDEILSEDAAWPEHFDSEPVDRLDQVGLVGKPLGFVNEFIYRSNNDQPAKTERLSLILRPWPSAYTGERAEVTDSIVVVHPRHMAEDIKGLRWLPLAFLTPIGDSLNINLGFVQAEISDGQIFIPGEFNQIWTKSGALRPTRLDAPTQHVAMRLFYIYFPIALISALALAWWFVRIWRRRSAARALA